MIKRVTCLGNGKGVPGEPLYNKMVQVGRILAEREIAVVTGAYGGVGMEAPLRGASSAGGTTVGYHMGRHSCKDPNKFISDLQDASLNGTEETLPPGSLAYSNASDTYVRRLGYLLHSDAFIIAAGFDLGTLVEISVLVNLNEKGLWTPKRIVILTDGSLSRRDSMILGLLNDLSDPPIGYLHITSNPQEAVDWILQNK